MPDNKPVPVMEQEVNKVPKDNVKVEAANEHIDALKRTIAAVKSDLEKAKVRAELDEMAPLSEGSPSSADAVMKQHQDRLDALEESLATAEKYLSSLK